MGQGARGEAREVPGGGWGERRRDEPLRGRSLWNIRVGQAPVPAARVWCATLDQPEGDLGALTSAFRDWVIPSSTGVLGLSHLLLIALRWAVLYRTGLERCWALSFFYVLPPGGQFCQGVS